MKVTTKMVSIRVDADLLERFRLARKAGWAIPIRRLLEAAMRRELKR